MRLELAIGAVAALGAIGAAATAGPAIVASPEWEAVPTAEDYGAYHPATTAQVLEARVTMECSVTTAGALERCRILSEEPAGQGFGEATLRLSTKFRMRLSTREGGSVAGARVRVPVRWTTQ